MRKLSILLILICGCSGPDSEGAETAAGAVPATLAFAGNLEDKNIAEASGLAASQRRPDILWTHNDSGAKARLYAIDLGGRSVGRAKLKKADNIDWEDIASFTLDETPYLLVADVGDNEHKRDTVMLYVVEEPDLAVDANPEITPAWRIEFSYPGGPRDVESVAVDIDNQRILLLAKRTIPAELYSLPLLPKSDEPQIATFLGEISSLPQPSQRDVDFALKTKSWHWQPTAMDIAPDGSAIAIVTLAPAVYLYERDGDWQNTLQAAPLKFALRGIREPESIAYSADGKSLYISHEKKHAALLRIDFN